jgi:hypothetical protein
VYLKGHNQAWSQIVNANAIKYILRDRRWTVHSMGENIIIWVNEVGSPLS